MAYPSQSVESVFGLVYWSRWGFGWWGRWRVGRSYRELDLRPILIEWPLPLWVKVTTYVPASMSSIFSVTLSSLGPNLGQRPHGFAQSLDVPVS
jgi:hypothetical protein